MCNRCRLSFQFLVNVLWNEIRVEKVTWKQTEKRVEKTYTWKKKKKSLTPQKNQEIKKRQQNIVRSDASGVRQMELSCVEWVFKSRQQKARIQQIQKQWS